MYRVNSMIHSNTGTIHTVHTVYKRIQKHTHQHARTHTYRHDRQSDGRTERLREHANERDTFIYKCMFSPHD